MARFLEYALLLIDSTWIAASNLSPFQKWEQKKNNFLELNSRISSDIVLLVHPSVDALIINLIRSKSFLLSLIYTMILTFTINSLLKSSSFSHTYAGSDTCRCKLVVLGSVFHLLLYYKYVFLWVLLLIQFCFSITLSTRTRITGRFRPSKLIATNLWWPVVWDSDYDFRCLLNDHRLHSKWLLDSCDVHFWISLRPTQEPMH